MKETPSEEGVSSATWRTSDRIIHPDADRTTPYDRVMLALDAAGFGGVKPKCPSCPPSKRRGFSLKETRTKDGTPTVLFHCHRGCTVEEVLAALGLDPASLYGGQAQGRLFDGKRYSPVDLDGWLALPLSSARNFGAATCLGSFLARDRTFRPVRGSAEIIAVVLSRRQRRRVYEVLGITPRRWRQLLARWSAIQMAHRCSSEQTTLFRHPEDDCPLCGKALQSLPTSAPIASALPVVEKPRTEALQSLPLPRSYELHKDPALTLPSVVGTYYPLDGYDGRMAVAYLEQDNARRARQKAGLHATFSARKVGGELSPVFLGMFPEHRRDRDEFRSSRGA